MRSFVALVLVSCLAAACGGSGAKTPRWPQMAAREEDGGESLAPRQSGVMVESSKDKEPEEAATPAPDVPATKPAEPANEGSAAPAVSTPVVAPEEVINVEDIVIEIED